MNISRLLVEEPPSSRGARQVPTMPAPPQDHIFSTRRASSSLQSAMAGPYMSQNGQVPHYAMMPPSIPTSLPPSPTRPAPKTVSFQLLLSDGSHHRARLPLRVHIQPHDTTDSIITTVKNFYGLYEGQGVSFQDSEGITLIATYENIVHNSVVNVRVTAEDPAEAAARRAGYSPRKARLGEPFQGSQPHSRPNSRASKKRSVSPSVRRSMSARAQGSRKRTRNQSHDGDSESDTGSVSVTSSRREQLASADISLDNIVEGGRRKRAKFESSELPLFAPPQQPSASISSMSPQRRPNNNINSPISNQFNFGHGGLPSPQSYGQPEYITSTQGNMVGHAQHYARGRTYSVHGPSRLSGGSVNGFLPTPDPTIGSVISDEDVALQLMRLGNHSQGRTSTSTLDDSLSRMAEAPSDGETDVEVPQEPRRKPLPNGIARPKLQAIDAIQHDSSGTEDEEDYDDNNDGSFEGHSDELGPNAFATNGERARSKSKSVKPRSNSTSVNAQSRPRVPSLAKAKSTKSSTSTTKIPPSPYGAPVRKMSSASTVNTITLNPDEEDLSAKPRCQRCRKSKKGCDRQRPCQRCKDAGIGIDGCVSEDEGNGRKGRYGRHMGVPLKTDGTAVASAEGDTSISAYSPDSDASKKRKR